MPILRHSNKLIFFSHIPKCAGASIEHYCRKIGIKVAFVDNYFQTKPANPKWNNSSPQHIDANSLDRLFPEHFFDAYFAVVRHPIERLKSAFVFQKYVERNIRGSYSLSKFVRKELNKNGQTIGFCDNHFLPQTSFISTKYDYELFKLEDGLGEVKTFIDQTFYDRELETELIHKNKRKVDLPDIHQELQLDNQAMEIVTQLYNEDFSRFGYFVDR